METKNKLEKWVDSKCPPIDLSKYPNEIVRLVTELQQLRKVKDELLEALKSARDVLVMASLIDKSATCSNEVNACDEILSTHITNYKP